VLFKKAFPDRFITVGIAEQNMMGMAAGLASCGKMPFAATFGVFTSMRAVEHVRNAICYTKLNVKIADDHADDCLADPEHDPVADTVPRHVLASGNPDPPAGLWGSRLRAWEPPVPSPWMDSREASRASLLCSGHG